ncbi:hypothetical protein KC19_1G029900 [Ceratodon purpureus]|uniref:Peptidase A1 domain-containing protein n=1 Tax=Ceratodon purpureus TaxID=3225 RepID=A0A8T0J0S8_CERPU|nr:hypothetical protein KC19_1G029900 [Ceratodon purpureus]
MACREIFIEMKLGEPPKPFYLHIDTGSGQTWVLCANGETLSIISSLGPNGLLVTEEESVVAYIGPTESLCRAHTSDPEHNMRCEEEDDYACFFSIMYADSSVYLGVVVNESMTLSMQDASEKRVFTLFGCVLEKHSRVEKLPLLTDGVDGLGRCEGSLVDQLWTSNVIQKKILGVCLAKELRQRPSGPLPAGRVGFISLGMDFSSKFDSQNLVWSKLAGPE